MGRGAGSQRIRFQKQYRQSRYRWQVALRRYLQASKDQFSNQVVLLKSKLVRAKYVRYRFWAHRYNVFLRYMRLEPLPWSKLLDSRVGAIGTKAWPLRVELVFLVDDPVVLAAQEESNWL